MHIFQDSTFLRISEHASLYTRTIDTHITRLRQKIENNPADPQYIITAHRVGYRLVSG